MSHLSPEQQARRVAWHATQPGGAYLEEQSPNCEDVPPGVDPADWDPAASPYIGDGVTIALARGWVKRGPTSDAQRLYATPAGRRVAHHDGRAAVFAACTGTTRLRRAVDI